MPDPAGTQRLDRLPPANEYRTVIRMIDGCPRPVIVRYRVGTAASPLTSPPPAMR